MVQFTLHKKTIHKSVNQKNSNLRIIEVIVLLSLQQWKNKLWPPVKFSTLSGHRSLETSRLCTPVFPLLKRPKCTYKNMEVMLPKKQQVM